MGKVISFIKQPSNLISVYFIICVLVAGNIIAVSDRLKDGFLIGFLFFIIIYFFFVSKESFQKFISKLFIWPNILLSTYILWAIITLPFALNKQVSLVYILGSITVFLSGFVLTLYSASKGYFSKLLYATVVSGCIALIYCLILLVVQFFNPDFISTFAIVDIGLFEYLTINNLPLLISFLGHPNSLGILLFYSFSACVGLLFLESEQKKNFLYPISVFLLIALLLTFSRSAILASIVFCFLLLWEGPKKGKRFIFAYFVILSIFMSSFFSGNIVNFYLERNSTKLFDGGLVFSKINRDNDGFNEFAQENDIDKKKELKKKSLSSRDVPWAASIVTVQKNPIIGAGFGNSPQAIEDNIPQLHSRFKGLTPHNTYLRTAVESGVVGLALYMTLIISFLWLVIMNLRKMETVGWIVFALVSGVLVFQMFETNFLLGTGYRSFYFLVFLAFGFALLGKAKIKSAKLR